jgi:hypothetical protein
MRKIGLAIVLVLSGLALVLDASFFVWAHNIYAIGATPRALDALALIGVLWIAGLALGVSLVLRARGPNGGST